MTNNEINKVISGLYGDNGVHIHPDVYPEVEELYLLSPAKFDKQAVAKFYQKFDYQGVRNALDIARNLKEFGDRVIYSDEKIDLTPSQKAWLEAIGWNVKMLQKAGRLA